MSTSFQAAENVYYGNDTHKYMIYPGNDNDIHNKSNQDNINNNNYYNNHNNETNNIIVIRIEIIK